jgi:hypothetical protein
VPVYDPKYMIIRNVFFQSEIINEFVLWLFLAYHGEITCL